MVFSQQSKQMPFGWSSNSSAYKRTTYYKAHVGDSTFNVLRNINKPGTKSDRPMFQQFWVVCLDCWISELYPDPNLCTKEGFQDHMKTQHMGIEEPRVQCTFCGAWLKNRGTLNKHMKIHTDSPQVCDICHKLKPTRTALNHHKRLVHGDAAFHCTICKKTFKRQLSLTVRSLPNRNSKIENSKVSQVRLCRFFKIGTYRIAHRRESVHVSVLPENVQIQFKYAQASEAGSLR